MTAPRLGLTLGDPAGIGPEIVARVLEDDEVRGACEPVVVGPAWAFDRAGGARGVAVVAPESVDAPEVELGHGSAASGAWAIATLDRAARMAEAGEVAGLVTAPVSKAAIEAAGHHDFVGHTEYFGERTGVPDPTMFFWSPSLCVSLVTVHCAVREVPARLSRERIATTVRRTADALQRLGTAQPRLAVCGLNPHAGEGGLLGREERDVIEPALAALRTDGFSVEGPLPADTAFMRAGRGDFDAVVAMYHDQGLGPFKLVAFDTGVNVTLGLPYVRTSVDHGTAFDIAGRGTADPSSLKAAVLLAARLVHVHAASR